jgi:hypothetical protein
VHPRRPRRSRPRPCPGADGKVGSRDAIGGDRPHRVDQRAHDADHVPARGIEDRPAAVALRDFRRLHPHQPGRVRLQRGAMHEAVVDDRRPGHLRRHDRARCRNRQCQLARLRRVAKHRDPPARKRRADCEVRRRWGGGLQQGDVIRVVDGHDPCVRCRHVARHQPDRPALLHHMRGGHHQALRSGEEAGAGGLGDGIRRGAERVVRQKMHLRQRARDRRGREHARCQHRLRHRCNPPSLTRPAIALARQNWLGQYQRCHDQRCQKAAHGSAPKQEPRLRDASLQRRFSLPSIHPWPWRGPHPGFTLDHATGNRAAMFSQFAWVRAAFRLAICNDPAGRRADSHCFSATVSALGPRDTL